MKTFSAICQILAVKRLNSACCASLLLAALSFHAQAEIYKWVDADGSIHYSDIKPNDKNASMIKTQTGKASTDTNATTEETTNDDSPQAQAQALEDQKKTEQDVADRQVEMDKAKADMDKKCTEIRDNLKKIEENSRIRIEEKGQVRFLSAEEIVEKKKTFQKMLEENCN